MNVKWYYRQSEVPDSVYQHLVQDRNNENGEAAARTFKHTRTCAYVQNTHTHTHNKVNTLNFRCSTAALCVPPLQTHTHLPLPPPHTHCWVI